MTEELSKLLHGKVLDVGCGHGEYTNRWADAAEEVVGYDMTEGFIATANRYRKPNVRFVTGRTHDGLPFPDHYFDVAYTKKGPSSWYREGNRIVRPGGDILLYHPGDGDGEEGELGLCFPGLFPPPARGTPILDKIEERLELSGLSDIRLRKLKEIIWIPTPEDILIMLSFGQSERFAQYVRETCFNGVNTLFERHAAGKGIKVTNFFYLIHAKATG